MGKLLVYLKDYKKESVLGPLFKLLEASFELIVPLVMAAIIDHGVADGDKPYIMKMCLVLVLLAVIGLTCSITAQYFAAKAAVGFSTGLRHALFEHIQKLSFSEMDTVGTSTLITRMTSDINQTQNGVNLVLRLFLRSPFIVFGAMIMAFTIDVKAALVFVVTIPLLSVVVFGIMLVSIPLYKKVQSALDKVLGITRENLTGSRVIRAFNKEDDEIADFNNSNDALTKIQLYVGKISALMNPLTYVIINGAVVVLVWTGAIRVNSGYITQGEVVALVNYMSQILVELIKLANLIININKSIACGNRIQAIFELQPSITDHAVTPVAEEKTEHSGEVPEVVFSHVGLTYAGAGEESLTDIDFTVKKGETIDKLLFGGYSTISLGYAGLCECTRYMTGVSHTEPETGTPFALRVMQRLNDACAEWKEKENMDFSLYGTPLESTTYKFAKCLQKRFGIIEGVTDKNYITNSYHVHVTENINAFDKLKFESQFQKLSPGGAISYVEVPNMQDNLEAVMSVLQFIYDNIMYAELNTKSDYCQVCGYDGEIKIVEDDGKLVWECPKCGNRDQNKLNVARRTCGYIGTQFWNQGRTQEIKDRVLHL